MEVDTVALAVSRPDMADTVEAFMEMAVALEETHPTSKIPPADETNLKSMTSTTKAVPPLRRGGNPSRHHLLDGKLRSQSHQKRKNQRLTYSASMLKIYLQKLRLRTLLQTARRQHQILWMTGLAPCKLAEPPKKTTSMISNQQHQAINPPLSPRFLGSPSHLIQPP